MKGCHICDGRGVISVAHPAPKTPFYKGVSFLPPTPELCSCVVAELGALRTALVANRLLPADHWTRGLPPRGLTGSVPPERSMVVLSTRRDGYRIVSHSRADVALDPDGTPAASYTNPLEALAPDGSVLRHDGQPLWWARVEDAERTIDRTYPLEET